LGRVTLADLTIRGTPSEVRTTLLGISAIIKFRKTLGWELFQADEAWRYFTEDDDRVCPVCRGNENVGLFGGADIPSLFPAFERKMIEGTAVVHPHVHETYPDLQGMCRCRIYMENIVETLLARLHGDKLGTM